MEILSKNNLTAEKEGLVFCGWLPNLEEYDESNCFS